MFAFSCGDAATAVEEAAAEAPTEVAAEAPTEAAAEAPTEAAAEPEAAPKSMLQSTVEAVTSIGGDITALPADAAVGNIEGWITKLSSMDGTEAVVTQLNALKSELSSGDIDGAKVSGILSTLAEQTKGLAGDNAMLGAVASALQAGAEKLGGSK